MNITESATYHYFTEGDFFGRSVTRVLVTTDDTIYSLAPGHPETAVAGPVVNGQYFDPKAAPRAVTAEEEARLAELWERHGEARGAAEHYHADGTPVASTAPEEDIDEWYS